MKLIDIRKKIISELNAASIKSAEIDAQILLESVTGKSREFVLTHPEFKFSDKQIKDLKKLAARRKLHEPIAYITGQKEFFGLDFIITPDVLIPRPETEILVEEGLKFLESRIKNIEFRILDIGTGSGNIIISIAKSSKKFPIANFLHFFASDISEKALMVAKKNAKKHQVKIKFRESDLFKNIDGKFDLNIANLPYVPMRKAEGGGRRAEEIDFEPREAIFTKENGTEIIKIFLDQAQYHINKNGLILAEVDPRNAIEIKKYAIKLYKSVELKRDFSGIYRMILILT